MLRTKLALAVLGLSAAWVNASPFTVDGINYEPYEGSFGDANPVAVLKGVDSYSIESLSVPSVVNYEGVEYHVNYIYTEAFDNCISLRTVRFEDSSHILKAIEPAEPADGRCAVSPFRNCPIEEYYVGRDIVADNDRVHQLVLESSAESVSITFSGLMKKISTGLFYVYPSDTSQILPRITSVSFGGDVREIASGTFADAVNLKSLTVLPGNAVDLRAEMFADGHVFDNVTLECSQYSSFSNIAFTHLTLGSAYLMIPERMLYYNQSVRNITLPEGITKIGNAAFMECVNLEEINFPSSLKEIDSYAFNGCKKLRNVVFNSGLKKIGTETFQACEGFDRIVIPGSVEEISQKAFFGAWNVNEILVEPSADGSVLKMGTEAFGVHEVELLELNRVVDHMYGTYSPLHLKSCYPRQLIFGEGWEIIPETIIKGEGYLQSVSLPSTLRKIGNAAFMDCENLEEINFPASLEEIDSYAFNGCKKLRNVVFNTGLKKIGTETFQACEGFDRIVIPGSVEEISQKAFFGAWNVNEILVEPSADGSVLKMGTEAFGVHEVESLELNRVVDHEYGPYSPLHLKSCYPRYMVFGEGWERIPEEMMANRDSLRSVSLPASLVRIDGSAFAGCPKLEKVTVHAVEPPVCGSDNVFASEIFPVATLTVPTGSRALYEEAFVWMNFSNIAISGNPVVSVVYNDEGGSVALNDVDTDMLELGQGDRLEVSIAPADGYELSNITVNGKDALDRVTDGLLIIEEVMDSVEIEVLFGLATGVDTVGRQELRIDSLHPGRIAVTGLPAGAEWQLYDIAGARIYSGIAGEVSVAPGIYVVRAGSESRRVMVR